MLHCPVPLKMQVPESIRSKTVFISNMGIAVPNCDVLPFWLNFALYYYIDIDFHSKGLRLNVSRSEFKKNNKFFEVKLDVERLIVESFSQYLESIRVTFHEGSQKTKDITNDFFFQFCSPISLGLGINELSSNMLAFFKNYFYFRCISAGKYTYLTSNKILEKHYIFLYEPDWIDGNDKYLEELSTSNDFDKDLNYVIVTSNELLYDKFNPKEPKDSVIHRIYNIKNIFPLSELIKFEVVDSLDGLLPSYWLLVKFTNYRSDNIIEDFHDSRLLNFEHPFIQLIIKNVDIFQDNDNKLYLEYFFEKFGSLRMHYDYDKLTEYQEKILNKLVEINRIGSHEIQEYMITKESLPPEKDYFKDYVFALPT